MVAGNGGEPARGPRAPPCRSAPGPAGWMRTDVTPSAALRRDSPPRWPSLIASFACDSCRSRCHQPRVEAARQYLAERRGAAEGRDGLGIYGNFLFRNVDRFGGAWLAKLGGPGPGALADFGDLAGAEVHAPGVPPRDLRARQSYEV